MIPSPAQTVYVVDDNKDVRESLCWLFESIGLATESFETAEAFLSSEHAGLPGCLVLDVRMPGMGGFALLERLSERGILTPVIVITGHGDVPMAVKALHLGAVDFVQKPLNHEDLLEGVRNALAKDHELRESFGDYPGIFERWKQLTPREEEVLHRLVSGQANKVIASELGIGTRTVETHRARIMDKLQIRSFASLVQLTLLKERRS